MMKCTANQVQLLDSAASQPTKQPTKQPTNHSLDTSLALASLAIFAHLGADDRIQ